MILSKKRKKKALIRLCGCADWSAHVVRNPLKTGYFTLRPNCQLIVWGNKGVSKVEELTVLITKLIDCRINLFLKDTFFICAIQELN